MVGDKQRGIIARIMMKGTNDVLQARPHVMGEYLRDKTGAMQNLLHLHHVAGDGIANRRTGMKLVDLSKHNHSPLWLPPEGW